MKKGEIKAVITLGYKRKQTVRKEGAIAGKHEGKKLETDSSMAEFNLFSTVMVFSKGIKMKDLVNVAIERGCKSIYNAFIAMRASGKSLPGNLFIKVVLENGKTFSTLATLDHPVLREQSIAKSWLKINLSKADRENTNVHEVAAKFVEKFKANVRNAATFVALEQKTNASNIEVAAKDQFNLSTLTVNQSGDIATEIVEQELDTPETVLN